jgi:hypothetical protein
MMPLIASMSGNGEINSESVQILESKTFDRIKSVLKMNQAYTNIVKDLRATFIINEGRLFVKPFDTKLGNIKLNLSGDQGLDQTINYLIKTEIPSAELGASAAALMGALSSQLAAFGVSVTPPEIIKVNLRVGGTFTDPVITPIFAGGTGSQGVAGAVAETVTAAAAAVAEEVTQKVSDAAREQADRILKEAGEKADMLRREAESSAATIREEADLQGKKLVKDAEARGPIAVLSAKKAADALNKEADRRATQLVTEANAKADSLLAEAKTKAEAEARAKAKQEEDAKKKAESDARAKRDAEEAELRLKRAEEREKLSAGREGKEKEVSMTASAEQKSEQERIIERLNRIHRRIPLYNWN